MSPRYLGFLAIPCLGLCLLACGGDSPVPPGTDIRIVTGTVTEIVDQVPVDGGVTITLRLADDRTERLTFGSLFTHPPPEPDRIRLYEVIREVEVGDRVRASGTAGEEGIELDSLTMLE
jgi:hypothetical protein